MDLANLYEKVRQQHGAIQEIAKRANKHRHTIRAVLQGTLKNSEVLKIAVETLLELEQIERAKQAEAENILKKYEALAFA